MPRALRREIRVFRFCLQNYFPAFFFPGDGAGDFGRELAELERIEPTLAAFELTRSLGGRLPRDRASLDDGAYRTMLLTHAWKRFPEAGSVVNAILEEPTSILRRLLELVGFYWDHHFAAEWRVRCEELEAERASVTAALHSGTLLNALMRAEPVLMFDTQRHSVTLTRQHDHEVAVSALPAFAFIPSDFAWPDCRISCDRPWAPALAYPSLRTLRSSAVMVPRASLTRSAHALGDPVRLAILRLAAQKPQSTEQLAGILGVSESTASEHLKALKRCGLLRRTRYGYYVLYETNTNTLECYLKSIADYVTDDHSN